MPLGILEDHKLEHVPGTNPAVKKALDIAEP
jgi:hypothetical protein